VSADLATGRVVCIGDLMVDVLAFLGGPLAVGSDTSSSIEIVGGGSAANTACWLVYAGARAALVAVIGDDDLGRRARADLASYGVQSHVAIDRGHPTGRCIVLVDATGERTMIPDAGANATLSLQHVESAPLGPADHLHLSGYALLSESARPASLGALDRARDVGASISIDVASFAPIIGVGADQFLSWLGTDLLILANADEAHVLTGETNVTRAAHALAERVGAAVVKTGRAGAVWAVERETVVVPTEPIEPRDTTGAGDSFAAGFLASRRNGRDPVESIRDGHRLATLCCQVVGGRPVLGDRRR
jgi:sugar/nucleoside kinase (ribokinase family)